MEQFNNKNLKIVFMGTPDFAVPVLRALAENYTVVGVVTKADKPKGRGNKMTSPPVKDVAVELGIECIQPENVKTDDVYDKLKSYDADLFVTAAYGKILPESILKLPKYGCINVHASLLPYYRGAAPIWRCIINGEKETGITTMMTDVGMDTGDILLVEKIEIDENMTTGELHDALSEIGARLIIKTIDGVISGEVKRVPQDHSIATYAPMVERDDGKIDWSDSAQEIHNLVRGTNPFPVSFGFLYGERIKIWKTCILKQTLFKNDKPAVPGTIIDVSKAGIDVMCGNGVIRILELQGASSKRMGVADYLNGHHIKSGMVFEA